MRAARARGETIQPETESGARAIARRGAEAARGSFHLAVEGLAFAGDGLLHALFRGPSVPRPRGTGEPFLVVGHRGSPLGQVENTIPSFEAALREGANAVEIDLCVTKGNEVVVYHDWDPDSVTSLLRQAGVEVDARFRPDVPSYGSDLRRPVCELTLEELREHYRFAEIDGGEIVPAHIATFGEFARWAADQPSLRSVLLDVKVPENEPELVRVLVRRVAAALERHPGSYRVIFLTPEKEVLRQIRAASAESLRSLDVVLPPGIVFVPSEWSAVKAAIEEENRWASSGRPVLTLAGWRIYRGLVRDDLERRSRHNAEHPARRIEGLLAWTVNDRSELRTLFRYGVHGILTDRPAVLRAIVDAAAGAPGG